MWSEVLDKADVGDSLDRGARLFPGQIDEDDVRVLPHPVEDDLPAVRRNVKASDRIPWLQIGELPALPSLQIDDPEILLEITAEQHDELPATRQKTVTIASSLYYYLLQR